MNNAEQVQREFEDMMRQTEAKAKRAEFLQGVERLEQLFAKAAAFGIERASAVAHYCQARQPC